MIKYTLYKVNDDGTTTSISEHPTAYEGITEGARVTETVDFEFAYVLRNGSNEVASFRPNRIAYREWAMRAGRMEGDYVHALDDRYDHDIEELGMTF